MMETKDMFARRREKIDLFKAFRNKKVTVQEKSVPDDLYTKCPSCGQPILSRKYRELLRVCPHCGAHGVLGVRDRLTATVDEGSFRELFGNVRSRDPLDFPGYAEKLSALEQKTGLREAVITGTARIGGYRTALAVMDSRFIMGSMSSAVGEKITRLAEYAAKKKLPLIIFCASGGARMQEGIYSLMQMAKTSGSHRAAGRGGLSLYQRADQSHHRRRDSILCLAGRYYPGRAKGTYRVCRPESDRTDHQAEAARGIPAGGISAGMRLCG